MVFRVVEGTFEMQGTVSGTDATTVLLTNPTQHTTSNVLRVWFENPTAILNTGAEQTVINTTASGSGVQILGAGEVDVTTNGKIITVSGTPHTGGAGSAGVTSINTVTGTITLDGADGNIVLTDGQTITVSGFRTEFVSTSGSLQSQIDAIDVDEADVSSLNTLQGDLTLSGTGGIIITDNGSTVITISGGQGDVTQSDLVTVSGHLQGQIDSIDVDDIEPAIIGVNGITVVSGTSTTTVSGFRDEFVNASGTLSAEIDSDIITHAADSSAHHVRYSKDENDAIIGGTNITVTSGVDTITISSLDSDTISAALIGVDGITIISGTNTTTVSGFRDEFVNTSGSLQSQINAVEGSDVDSVNTLTGDITIGGVGEVFVTTAGSTITVSGTPHEENTDTISAALLGADGITIISGTSTTTVSGFHTEFLNTSGTLSAEIDSDVAVHTADASAHHTRYTKDENDAIIGSDGITIVSGSNTIEVQGFRTEFVSTSGSLQTQIDGIDSSVTLQDAYDNGTGVISTTAAKSVLISGAADPALEVRSNTVVMDNQANDDFELTLAGGTTQNKAVRVMFQNQSTDRWSIGRNIDGNFSVRDEFNGGINALTIELGAPATSMRIDSSGNTIHGGFFPDEKLHVVGSGYFTEGIRSDGPIEAPTGTFATSLTVSGIPVALSNDDVDVNSLNTLQGDLTIAGAGGNTIVTSDPTITVSGFRDEFVAASGSLQTQLDGIDSSVTLQDAYDNGDGTITMVSGQPIFFESNDNDDNDTFIVRNWDITTATSAAQIVSKGGRARLSLVSTSESAGDAKIQFFRDTSSLKFDFGLESGSDDKVLRFRRDPDAAAVDVMVVDGSNDRVGIMTDTPTCELDVVGEICASSGTFADSLTVSGVPVALSSDDVDVSSLNSLQGALTISGTDGNTVLTADPVITVSGFRDEFVSTSGSLQTQIDNAVALDFNQVYDNTATFLEVDVAKPMWIRGNPLTNLTTLIQGNTMIQTDATVGSGYLHIESPRITLSGTSEYSTLDVKGHDLAFNPVNMVWVNGTTTLSGSATIQHIIPAMDNTYDVGDTDNHIRTLFLANPGGNAIEFRTAIGTGSPTDYTFALGGGGATTEGGTFTFQMDDMGTAPQTFNQIVFDVGRASLFPGYGNRYKFTSDMGIGIGIANMETIIEQLSGTIFAGYSLSTTLGNRATIFLESVDGNAEVRAGRHVNINAGSDTTGNIVLNEDQAAGQIEIKGSSNDDLAAFRSNSIDFGEMLISEPTDSFLRVYVPDSYTLSDSLTDFGLFRTITDNSMTMTSDMDLIATAWFREPNINTTGSGLVEAATVYVEGAPTEAGSGNYALLVESGAVRFDDDLTVSGTTTAVGALNIPYLSSDPGSPSNGDVWIRSDTNDFKYRSGGTTYTVTGV